MKALAERLGRESESARTGVAYQTLINEARAACDFYVKNGAAPASASQRCHQVRTPAQLRLCYETLRCATLRDMKIRTITQRELRNESGAVLREVEAGRTIIVSRNGTPVGELRPIKRRRFVARATITDASGNAVRIDAARFRADLDAVVNPHPHD